MHRKLELRPQKLEISSEKARKVITSSEYAFKKR